MLNRPRDTWLSYSNGMKIGGVKISIDGSPQGKTAAFITPYLVPGPNGEQGWKGELFAPQEAIDAGLRPTNHTDAVVVPLDQMFMLWTSVNRLSRGGEVIGADQRVSPYEGLLSMTLWAAEQYGEEASKGSIATGKCADLVILSADPAKVAPETIKDIKSGADDQGRQGDLDGIRSGRDLIRRYFVFGSAIGAPPWMTPKRSANDGAFRTEGLLLPASLAHSVRVSARDMVPLTGEDHPPCFETCLRKLRRTRVWSR